MRITLALGLLITGCKTTAEPPTPSGPDADGDGSLASVDCNDSDPQTFPGAPERCDLIDNNCDGDNSDIAAVHIEGGPSAASLPVLAAVASPGDVLVLCPGTHLPTVVNGVTLRGSDDGVIIGGGGSSSAVLVSGGDVVLERLTLSGGVGSQAGDQALAGGGVNGWLAETLTLTDVVVRDNSATFGGGVIMADGDLILDNVLIEENTAEDGGGIHIQGGTLLCANSEISNNTAESGGGIRVHGGSVTGCVVSTNTASEDGGGMFLAESVTLDEVQIADNTAGNYGGGLYSIGFTDAVLTGVTVERNLAHSFGGGGFLNPDTVFQMAACIVQDNDAGEDGGGFYVRNATITGDVDIFANTAALAGGGVATFEGATLIGLDVEGNHADLGAGISARGPIDIQTTLVLSNLATTHGGGVYAQEADLVSSAFLVLNNTAGDRGGGVYLRESSLVGTDTEINGNTAVLAAGLYASSAGQSSVVDVSLSENVAAETGGGIATLGTLAMEGVSLIDNEAGVRGGGLYAEGTDAVVTFDGLVQGNTAVDFGGGVYAHSEALVTVTGSVVSNQAARGAGLYVNGGASLSLDTASVTDNGDDDTVSGGGVRVSEGALEASDVTFASNLPDDVYTVGNTTAYDFAAVVSFSCTELGCL